MGCVEKKVRGNNSRESGKEGKKEKERKKEVYCFGLSPRVRYKMLPLLLGSIIYNNSVYQFAVKIVLQTL